MTNSWWEIQAIGDAALEDSIFWRFEQFGCRGTACEQHGNSITVKAYLPQNQADILDLAALSLWLRQDAIALEQSSPVAQWKLIDEEDWSSSWKQHWEITNSGDRLVIVPAWLKPPENSDRLPIILDPGVAFGTGAHATTQLCLESLEMRLSLDQSRPVVADIGCGSGILSIASVLLGASRAYAVDVDPLAIDATERSCEANGITRDQVVADVGSIDRLLELTAEPVDGIICNILAEVIVDLVPKMDRLIKPTTWGIISGVLLEQAKAMADVLEQNGWVVATLWKRGEWCCFNIRRA